MSISSQREESTSLLINLPEEVHDEIFLNLPAKSILVSRCVCKVFYNLLSKPNFIRNHLNRTILSKANPKILFGDTSPPNTPIIYSVPIDYASISSLSSSVASCLSCDGSVLLNCPFESKKLYSFDFLGSCNGLICLSFGSTDAIEIRKGKIVTTYYYTILNPLTREYKEFRRHGRWFRPIYGFGYDSNNDDYKLVVISDYAIPGCFNIYVYSLRSDSWSSIQPTVNYSFRPGGRASRGVFLNGALHWLGSIPTKEISSQVIVSFDVSNGTMLDMPLPENIMLPTDFQGEMYTNLGLWGNCICVAFIWGPVIMDVWVMQEYGVKESWIRKITSNTAQPWSSLSLPYWKLLWCFDNGEILVNNGRMGLLLYDPTTERVRSLVVHRITTEYNIESYMESVVSLESGTYIDKPKSVTNGIVKNPKRQHLR